jgi:hypothetical protein
MAANLALAPSEWGAHANYPHNILLLKSHAGFRARSDDLLRQAQGGRQIEPIVASFRWWKSAMRSHEHYEEGKLYPYLEHRWGVTCDHLTAGHEALAEADTAVVTAQSSADLAQALRGHHDVLLSHLDLEERLVVPALLALSRREFDVYYRSSLRRLLEEVSCHAPSGCRHCS